MTIRSVLATAVTGVAILSIAPASIGQVMLRGLGLAPGAIWSEASGVSADGSVVFGSSRLVDPTHYNAFRWTPDNGMTDIGAPPSRPWAITTGASADGLAVAGWGQTNGVQDDLAFRWTSAGGYQELPHLPGYARSRGRALSADGSVVVGMSARSTGSHLAVRWNASGEMQSIAFPGGGISEAHGASADGSVVVGDAQTLPLGSTRRAFRWTEAGGIQDLGVLPGFQTSVARAVSADGWVVAGDCQASFGVRVSFIWTAEEGMRQLPEPFLTGTTVAFALSGDGSTVVGWGQFGQPVLWNDELGAINIERWLPTVGIDLDGWSLSEAHAVSHDGRTIVGYGAHEGRREAWVLTIPSPGSALALVASVLCTATRWRRSPG